MHAHAHVAPDTKTMPTPTAKVSVPYLAHQGNVDGPFRSEGDVEREKEERRVAMERGLRRWMREM